MHPLKSGILVRRLAELSSSWGYRIPEPLLYVHFNMPFRNFKCARGWAQSSRMNFRKLAVWRLHRPPPPPLRQNIKFIKSLHVIVNHVFRQTSFDISLKVGVWVSHVVPGLVSIETLSSDFYSFGSPRQHMHSFRHSVHGDPASGTLAAVWLDARPFRRDRARQLDARPFRRDHAGCDLIGCETMQGHAFIQAAAIWLDARPFAGSLAVQLAWSSMWADGANNNAYTSLSPSLSL